LNTTENIKRSRLIIYLTTKEKIFLAAKIFIAIFLVAYLVNKIGSVNILNVFVGANLWIVFIVFLLSIFNVYIQFIKWKLLCKICLNENDNTNILLSLFYGFAAAAFTPGKIGEYFARELAFKDKSLLEVSLATAIDKLFNLFIILFVGSISVIIYLHYNLHLTSYLTISLFILLFSIFFIIGYILLNEKTWQNVFFRYFARIKFIRSLAGKIRLFKNLNKKTLTTIAVYSILFYSCFILQYSLLVTAFSTKINFVSQLWAGSLTFFVKTLIPAISVGDLGIREAASVYFLSSFGLPEQVGFNAAFILFLINVLIPAFIGFLLLFKKNK
jgi:uncharacterized protein (TIRG00374 family)